ncbi:MAG: hypothetical protein KC457_07165 [Myxococcales bacterium]|nr:hypothetical protein [Myxococcales bacterium]
MIDFDELRDQLRTRIGNPLIEIWTPALKQAAKTPAETAPGELARLSSALQEDLSSYASGGTADAAALRQLCARVEELDVGLGEVREQLRGQKNFKNDSEKATLDEAKAGLSEVQVALARWLASLERAADLTR